MSYSVTPSGQDEALASIMQLAGDLPGRALADALNHTINQTRPALKAAMAAAFDRPTPFTLNAVRLLNATPKRLEARVWVQDEKDGASKGQAPEDWVAPQVFGGPRVDKKSEILLRAKGLLPAGRFVVPGAGAKLDSYGNVSRGQIAKILSGLKASEGRAGYTSNASSSRRSVKKGNALAYFVMRRGNVAIGIGERRGKSLAIVLAFVSLPQYQRRLAFHAVVEQVAEANLEQNIDKAITDALTGNLPTNFKRRPQG